MTDNKIFTFQKDNIAHPKNIYYYRMLKASQECVKWLIENGYVIKYVEVWHFNHKRTMPEIGIENSVYCRQLKGRSGPVSRDSITGDLYKRYEARIEGCIVSWFVTVENSNKHKADIIKMDVT